MSYSVRLIASSILHKGSDADVTFVPPLQRRRLSPLQRNFFYLAHQLIPTELACETVFATRWGELSLTQQLKAQYATEGDVSPLKFSTSVYNAAPGLYSIHTKNRESYTAIVADEETLENGLMVAILSKGCRALIYAEEEGDGYGCGVLLDEKASDGIELAVAFEGSGSKPIAFCDFVDFLDGKVATLQGARLTLRRS